jgi:hypothetical protein
VPAGLVLVVGGVALLPGQASVGAAQQQTDPHSAGIGTAPGMSRSAISEAGSWVDITTTSSSATTCAPSSSSVSDAAR